MSKKLKFKQYEAIVFEPTGWTSIPKKYPVKLGEVVYFLGLIPNVPGHCIVVTHKGKTIPMLHPEDFRKAKDEEL